MQERQCGKQRCAHVVRFLFSWENGGLLHPTPGPVQIETNAANFFIGVYNFVIQLRIVLLRTRCWVLTTVSRDHFGF
jgi:hypothetical protein